MANIVETLAGDRRIELSNEEIVRKFSFGPYWRYIEIGVRVSINGSSDITTPGLYIGVCSGDDGLKAASVVSSIAGRFPGNTQNLVYNAGPPAYYACSAVNGFSYVYKIGSTTTGPTTLGIGSAYSHIASTSATPHYLAVGFYRIGPGVVVHSSQFPNSSAKVQAGIDDLSFRYNLENADGPAASMINSHTYYNADTTINWDCPLSDRAFIYWDQASPTCEISDWRVVRLA